MSFSEIFVRIYYMNVRIKEAIFCCLSFLSVFTLFTKFPLSNILELPSGFSITSAKINAIPYFFNHSISYLIFHIQCFYT